MVKRLKAFVAELGWLRGLLLGLGILLVLMSPRPGTEMGYEGWALWHTVLVPAVSPLVFMVLMFDVMMGRIRLSSVDAAEQVRLRRVTRVSLLLALLILAVWLPFLLSFN